MFPELIGQFNPIYFESIDSTNEFAKRELMNRTTPFLVVADEQTAGKGKRDRQFYSPKNSGIYLSFVYPSNFEKTSASDLPTIKAGVATLKTLDKLTGKSFMLKWVNDVIYQGKKVAGILAEKTQKGLVIGIGINLSKPESIPDEISTTAGWIYEEPISIKERQRLVVELAQEMSVNDSENLIQIYSQYSSLLNKKVELQIGLQKVSGTVTGFNNQGGIILDNNQSFLSGEVIKVNEK
jgi:BirA family biotin operon repressor/biotin-[acetyl-CoA-carboxylase] ligase